MIDCDNANVFMGSLQRIAESRCIPLNVTFELTPHCNFDCVMCYVRLTKEQAAEQGRMLTADEWLQIAGQVRDSGALNLCLTGGEPLAHPDFWEIYSKLNEMGFLISVLSNGSLIDETAIEKFRLYGKPFCIKLTLYGASDGTYESVCGCADGFTRISKAIDLLKAEQIPLKMSATVVKQNAEELQKMYAFANEKGVPFQHTISVLRSPRGAVNSAEESRFALHDFPDEITLEELEKTLVPPIEFPFVTCGSYRNSMWVTWHGHVQLCSFLAEPYVQYSGDAAADFKALMSALEKLKCPSECADCRYKMFCQRCPGILCAESGHPEKIDKGFCLMAEKLFRIYEKKKGETV